MGNAKLVATLMSTSTKLDANERCNKVDVTMFKRKIGSLLYPITTRLDIMFSICMCAWFQANLKESHLTVVKRILRYLIGT